MSLDRIHIIQLANQLDQQAYYRYKEVVESGGSPFTDKVWLDKCEAVIKILEPLVGEAKDWLEVDQRALAADIPNGCPLKQTVLEYIAKNAETH